MQHSGLPVLHHIRTGPGMRTSAGEFSYHQPTRSLIVLQAASAHLRVHGCTYAFSGFGCISLPPHTTLYVKTEETAAAPLRFYACTYEWVDTGAAESPPLVPTLAKTGSSDLLEQAAELYDAYAERLYNALSQRLLLQSRFLKLFADALWTLEQPDAMIFIQQQDGIDRVLAHLHKYFDRRMERDEAAALAGLSVRQFTASFKRRTGYTLIEYLNRLRIDEAKAILLQSRQRLNEIARQVGYADEFYLSRKFKQVAGMSPTEYVRKPKRIATLDYVYTLDLLSLGVMPCAAVTDYWVSEQFRQQLHSSEFQPIYWQMSQRERLQVLQDAKPDIILHPMVESDEETRLEPYRRIGLVIQIPWRDVNWRQRFLGVAELTGMERRAHDWLARFDERAGAAREALSRFLPPRSTVAIINVRSDRLLIYAYGYMGADLLYDVLKLTPPGAVEEMRIRGLEHPEFSLPQLPSYDADHYFLSIENSAAARRRAAELMQSPEWLARTAVKRRCVYPVDMTKWYGYGPAALDAQLDDVIRMLLPNCPNNTGPN